MSLTLLADQLDSLLATLSVDPDSAVSRAAQRAAKLAARLQDRATALQTPQERKQQMELERMMQTPSDKATVTEITDQAFRSRNPHRAADQLTHILDVQGVPRFFGPLDRTLMRGFQSFGCYLPGVAVPLVKEKMREETANVILPAEEELLAEHLRARRDQGVRMNVNNLGEALLGEQDAARRLAKYLKMLQMPDIEVISVKISTLYSQIWPIAREHTIATLCDRMELLYRASAKSTFTRSDGAVVPKFVYLDMEEYRDMSITADVFMRTLDRPRLKEVGAGIALQAYVPDSYETQLAITEWARKRVADGGGPVTIRIVKGANLEMERVEASLRGWEQAPYPEKVMTDANYKRMLHEGLKPENIAAVRLGLASHNLFDIAYGLVLGSEAGVLDQIQFEMLEGMANHQRRALFELVHNLLLYAPATPKEGFIHAIGYLIRRLDENTGPENFLRHAFKLEVGSEEWHRLEAGFFASFERLESLPSASRREQNRGSEALQRLDPARAFVNESDTDFSLPHHSSWADQVRATWFSRCGSQATHIPAVIAGTDVTDRERGESFDPSRPGTIVADFAFANIADVEAAVSCAAADPRGWRQTELGRRATILADVATELRRARGDLLGAAMAECGKTFIESDPEISEAIDFVEYYMRSVATFAALPGLSVSGKGVVAVIPPWNFPIAIPCGGIAAGLAAGNTVIIKPAPDAVLCAYLLCQCFWRAGVPKEVLQFVPTPEQTGGSCLVTHADVDVVILTGGTDTAQLFLKMKPEMRLLAETGGKNATIVTALADREAAIRNVLHSAFGHAGQKCSATSLLLLEAEVCDDPAFRETLVDAARSIIVGSAWQPQTRMGPLINPPGGALETALKELEPGETWALMPHHLAGAPTLYSPGIKWGVKRGSFTHLTEFFGPVLGVMKVANLAEAIAVVNETGYGLTSGLESLDDREQLIWRQSIKAGNLYINRPTTGAIVQRQPFGGMGKSAFGPGIKAGGPNYVAQLMDFQEHAQTLSLKGGRHDLSDYCEAITPLLEPDEVRRTLVAVENFVSVAETEFAIEHDDCLLIGEDNIRRYLPVGHLRIRVHLADSAFELLARVAAARVVGCHITVSTPTDPEFPIVDALEEITDSWGGAIEFVEESDDRLVEVVLAGEADRLRYAGSDRVPLEVRTGLAGSGVYIADAPVLVNGRVELLAYVQEQSLSHAYHRYGNLGMRTDELRSSVR